MRIDCPWCGARPLHEFTYGGDANTDRPQQSEDEDLNAWMEHVYLRDNPAGLHNEYWQHVAGCRSWLVVTRDTTTHVIEKTAFAAQPASEASNEPAK